MKERNLEYERKFKAYLFNGDLDRHKDICKNLNVKPNIPEGKTNLMQEINDNTPDDIYFG